MREQIPHLNYPVEAGIEDRRRIWNWLGGVASNNQDPNLLGPLLDWTPRATYSSSVPGDLPESGGLTGRIYAPTGQRPSLATRRSRSASPFFQETSSHFPITRKKSKHVRFADLPDMQPTPVKVFDPREMETTRGRAATREPGHEPGHEPFHARVASRPHLEDSGGVPQHPQYPQYYSHSRNNSVSASQAYPQQLSRQPTPEQGRTLQKTYEFQSNESDKGLTPVLETTMENRLPHAMTMNDIINGRDTESRGRSRSMSRHKSPLKPAASVSAQPRDRRRPAPLDLDETNRYGVVVRSVSSLQPTHNHVYSLEPEKGQTVGQAVGRAVANRSSSVYMDDTPLPFYDEPSPSPLYVPTKDEMRGRATSILQGYNVWKEENDQASVGDPVGAMERTRSTPAIEQGYPTETLQASDRVSQGPSHDGVTSCASPVDEGRKELEAPPFTPLTPYLMHTRMGSKTMIGNKGWLEDTASQTKKPVVKKKDASFIGTVKKTARRIAAEMTEFRGEKPRVPTARELNISLDPREQSLLYCELEFILSNTLSAYINIQLHSGRLNPHIHAKISDGWQQKGRPKVVGFRYDLETQIDMISAHVGSFRFYGPHQANQDVIKGCLYGMKMNARAMRIHTYCQPDPVIAKHILDAQTLMLMLDSPESVQVPLTEVSQFFKVVIEREKDMRKKRSATRTHAGCAPNAGPLHRDPENLSPPKGRHPGEYRVKNQINVPQDERSFSGPVLEPKVYDPLRSNPTMGRRHQ
ncbi:hypothetical protein F4781DRAFT_423189 [Annulohypoxylon bovei var. microspora]|nr:hypothetical protein F4781DRAFT_423189 [Annulohypoxylon bovei var. microspora]